MANDIDDITYNADGTVTVMYTDGTSVTSANQKEIDETSDKDSSGGGIFATIFGAIPGILSALFPSGIGKNNYPTVTTTPGVTTLNTGANSTNTLLIGAVVILVLIILFMSTKQPAKAKK